MYREFFEEISGASLNLATDTGQNKFSSTCRRYLLTNIDSRYPENMWILFALGSAFFAGITAVLAKLGIHGHDSTLVTALRTSVVFLGAWIVAAISLHGHFLSELTSISSRTYLFLFLSGLATGASWLCFFAALSKAPVTFVSPIDKSSTIIAIAFAVIFLGESLSPIALVGVLILGIGIVLTLEPGLFRGFVSQRSKTSASTPLPDAQKAPAASWMIFALASAVFAALTSILGKIGITGVDSNLGTAVRTSIVLLMAWIVVALHAKPASIHTIPLRDHAWIAASGIATTASWLCYYRALQEGPASIIVPIDKLSILVTVAFSALMLRERVSGRYLLGIAGLCAGTVLMVIG